MPTGQKFLGKPRIVFIDIETSPLLGRTWKTWDTDIIEVERNTQILSFAYSWGGKVEVLSWRTQENEKKLLKKLWRIVDAADLIVAQNGDKFDIRVMNGRFLFYDMKPPRQYITVDTLKILRKFFKLDSNKLDDVCLQFGLGGKLKHHGKNTWLGCLRGDTREWRNMERYNKHDVVLLIDIYHKLIPWLTWKENRRKPIVVKN